jgi:hypothetical protein
MLLHIVESENITLKKEAAGSPKFRYLSTSRTLISHMIVLLSLKAGRISDFVFWHISIHQKANTAFEYSKSVPHWSLKCFKGSNKLNLFNTSYMELAYVCLAIFVSASKWLSSSSLSSSSPPPRSLSYDSSTASCKTSSPESAI